MIIPYQNYNRKCCFLKLPSSLKQLNNYFQSWSIVFFGSDSFSLGSLKELLKPGNNKFIKNLEIVTPNSNTKIFKFAQLNNIKVHLWPPELRGEYDLGVIVSFGKLIPKKLIDVFPLGIINIHASLLPKWRGSAPIVYALMNGDTETGITIQKINPDKFDTGDIVIKKALSIGKNEMLPSLYSKLKNCGSKCLIEVISELPESLQNCEPQQTEGVTYARKIRKDVSLVKWNDSTAVEIYNLYRALFSLYDLKTTWRGSAVKLICMSLNNTIESLSSNSQPKIQPGSFNYNYKSNCLTVQCKDKPINVCTVRFQNKLYTAKNFYYGFMSKISKSDWVFN